MTDCDRFAQILDTFKSLRLPDARSAIEKNQPRSLFPFFSYLFLFSFHSIRIVRFVLDTDDFSTWSGQSRWTTDVARSSKLISANHKWKKQKESTAFPMV